MEAEIPVIKQTAMRIAATITTAIIIAVPITDSIGIKVRV